MLFVFQLEVVSVVMDLRETHSINVLHLFQRVCWFFQIIPKRINLLISEPANQQDLSDVSSCVTPCDSSTQLCISGECICKSGFRRNSTLSGSETCADIDECAEKSHKCDRVATCRNTFGSHVCTCPDGHVGDGITCVPHVNQGKLSGQY